VSRSIRVVTFDYWNTLIAAPGEEAHRKRIQHWLDVLAEAGHERTPEEVAAGFTASWAGFNQAWRENRQFVTADSVATVLEALDLVGEAQVAEMLIQDYAAGAVEPDLRPTPNIGDALETLRSAGVKVGIICDVGVTPSVALRAKLESFGLLDFFDHHSFSDDVGTYKPDPAIFAHALDGLGGADPAEAAHVGDLRRTDVAGANGVGWTSVRYTGIFDDDGVQDEVQDIEADHVVADHADLPAALGLA
jgi:putative hydrolase of the HAD superfamily